MHVGFIGLGTMGAHMARSLQRAGHALVVNDVQPQAAASHLAAGATWADTPLQVGAASEIVFTSLPGPPEVESVALGDHGLLAGVRPGTVFVDLSTNSPITIRRLHARFAEQGVHVLDAPLSDGPSAAESGKLGIWVGGDQAVFERVKPVLEDIGNQVMYVGPSGAGSVTKLVHNCAGFGIQAVLAEVFTLGVKAGVDPLTLFDALRQGVGGRRRTFDRVANGFLQGSFDNASFFLRLGHKDMSLATALAQELQVPMRLADLALDELTEAMNRGWGARDSSSPMLLQEERAGVQIAVEDARVKDVLARDGFGS